jgi:subtilase family serine protease
MRRAIRAVLAAVAGAAMVAFGGGGSEASAAAPIAPNVVRSCSAPVQIGLASCLALRRTDTPSRSAAAPAAAPAGLAPADLRSAYKLSTSGGAGQTVAIVDAFDDPNAEADLGGYRSTFGIPACTTANGCFRKVNQNGQASPLPASNVGWAEEISLDVDMVSAICPNCHILLVEATSNSLANLGASVNRAVTLGAKFVSNSYGGGESSGETGNDTSFYRHAGVAVTASSGDGGFGVEYPAASQFVTAVGGTSLTKAANARGWTESAWNGAGSGCSGFEAKPAFQNGLNTNCARRAVADVSAVADPNTGVAVFDSFQQSGFLVFGGTSVASPVIASVYALAGTPAANTFPNSDPYAHKGNLFDVTTGSNSRTCGNNVLCKAGAGWDGPTGLGTPNGTAAFHS